MLATRIHQPVGEMKAADGKAKEAAVRNRRGQSLPRVVQ